MFNDIKYLQLGIGHALYFGMMNYTIQKEYTEATGDTYASVFLDGKLVLMTLWLGESDTKLIEQAKAKIN